MNVEPLPVGSAEDLLIVLQPEYARANEFRPRPGTLLTKAHILEMVEAVLTWSASRSLELFWAILWHMFTLALTFGAMAWAVTNICHTWQDPRVAEVLGSVAGLFGVIAAGVWIVYMQQ